MPNPAPFDFKALVNLARWERKEGDPSEGKPVRYYMMHVIDHGGLRVEKLVASLRESLRGIMPNCSFAITLEDAHSNSEIEMIGNETHDQTISHASVDSLLAQHLMGEPSFTPHVEMWCGKQRASITISVTEGEYDRIIAPLLLPAAGRSFEDKVKGHGNGKGQLTP